MVGLIQCSYELCVIVTRKDLDAWLDNKRDFSALTSFVVIVTG